jgi:putative membrane protein
MESKNKYSIWIKIVSVAIPLVVAILFGVRVDYELPIFLPPIYSSLNAITAVLLVVALMAIKSKKN